MVMLLDPTAVKSVILATLTLHNISMTSSAKTTGLCDNRIVRHRGSKLGVDIRLLKNDNCADSMFSLEKPTLGHNASIAAKKFEISTLSILE